MSVDFIMKMKSAVFFCAVPLFGHDEPSDLFKEQVGISQPSFNSLHHTSRREIFCFANELKQRRIE